MILLIDSYDSFTNNLADLIAKATGQEVVVVHNDSIPPSDYATFAQDYLRNFDWVVIGPGPGHPANDSDVGIIKWLLDQYHDPTFVKVPILGVCLGFQAVCHAFGSDVERLDVVRHGQVFPLVVTDTSDLFAGGSSPVDVVRYHSLYVPSIGDDLKQLAYCEDEGKAILMAVKHRELPLYGVQYHPESVCSTQGLDLIKNFADIAKRWNDEHRQQRNINTEAVDKLKGIYSVHFEPLIESGEFAPQADKKLISKTISLDDNVGPVDVCDHLHHEGIPFVLLNSAAVPGEWSVIGLPIENQSEVITHSVDTNEVTISSYGSKEIIKKWEGSGWEYLGQQMKRNYVSPENLKLPNPSIPFVGGYMGIISYEEGQHITLSKLPKICNGPAPDMKLVWIDRVLVFDHIQRQWHIMSFLDDDDSWIDRIVNGMNNVKPIDLESIPMTVEAIGEGNIEYDLPVLDVYREQFARCQEYLHSGDSYELCLTTQSTIRVPTSTKAWDIYKVLTLRKNPSPYSCFFEFDDCVLISSSPERFLSWKRTENGKLAQLRPIKGTVRNTPEVTFADAERILRTPKEMGENLMIVDLIRHDLLQFLPQVDVPQLMRVEEYATVYQLVSVINGYLADNGYKGIDVLCNSLPPGSMTGAPKKRSIELLQDIEALQPGYGRRGIYSGVVGYWSVTDDSDWSVVIRSAFHYPDDKLNTDTTKLWRIGAGGAITVLSNLDDEWEEMRLKLTSALQAFTNNVNS
ncbi:hypothetical protein DIURU_000519 [Diutina rugosa]|uniref:aminodeoxychorismate synthase n=1 Tax=Diutina rugosa TaxID=5481 RepID=A0A642UXW5_DIURU|nr:uncharacterized protein DIURU_000519 [Diutina rugosa]KAA8907512.1 hypothetical protein DIURU_000519 [Diutina rugosa]